MKIRLWGRAAGRCQYEGCNTPLWLDGLTQAEFNVAYVAHIIGDKPSGPRGHPTLSARLHDDISNLMLMCDKHHRLIDKEDVAGHPVERLTQMKQRHEARIETLGSIQEERRSFVVLYGANIGQQTAKVSFKQAGEALVACGRYPAERPAIELSLNSPLEDCDEEYWAVERESLRRQFARKIEPRQGLGQPEEVDHFSVLGIAPIPLLIELGRLLSDVQKVDVYQLHREPQNWKWHDEPDDFQYDVIEPESINDNVAVNLSLSATIDNSRIRGAIDGKVSVWTLTHPTPHNDFPEIERATSAISRSVSTFAGPHQRGTRRRCNRRHFSSHSGVGCR